MQTRPAVTVRNLHFSFDSSIPRHWFGGNAARSAFFDSQSLFFAVGERFFVDSVKAAVPGVRDPELARQARLFCGQEGIHQREHVRYNQMLEERGYPALKLERWVARLLKLVTFTLLVRWRLAVTCALEHFTAISAARGLAPNFFDGADPRMRAFWRWHAAEEIEHKSIPFDVYHAVGGNYLERVTIMFLTTIVFRAYAMLHLLIFMHIDGQLWSRKAWAGLSELTARSGGNAAFLRDYLAYYRRDFHPLQLDHGGQLESFHADLQSSPLYASAFLSR